MLFSCNGDGNGINICFSGMSSEPCFDSNEGGSTTVITGRTTEEVIAEQQGREDFIGELEITSIVRDRAFVGIPSGSLDEECIDVWAESELVIKDEKDWDRFRDSCFFSLFDLPDVDFSNRIIIVSMQDIDGLGTEIEAVLEFDSEVVVVIRDDESDPPPPAPGFPFHIVSVSRVDLPFDFIRVKNVISP